MISSSQREHLVYTLTGQVSLIFLFIGWALYYVLPWRANIAEAQVVANSKITEFNVLKKDGLTIDAVKRIASTSNQYEELLKIIGISWQNAANAITKDSPDMEYLDWIKGKVAGSDSDKAILVRTKTLINSIIPTMSSAGSIEEEMLTLKGMIIFIEGKFIKQFNVQSTSPIGISGMNFWKVKDLPDGIGYLDIKLEVTGTSDNIMRLIRYINKSGDPTALLAEEGNSAVDSRLLQDQSTLPKILENPLITITQFSLQDLPTNLGPNEENTGRLSLRLYLRGWAPQDIRSFQNQLIARIDRLITTIQDQQDKCKNTPSLCTNEEKNKVNNEKLRIIRKGMNDAIKNKGGLWQIYVLSQFFNTIKNLEDEINIVPSK